jgi:hypothetical protein
MRFSTTFRVADRRTAIWVTNMPRLVRVSPGMRSHVHGQIMADHVDTLLRSVRESRY